MKFVILFFIIFMCSDCYAQLNFGLKKQQDTMLLPKSRNINYSSSFLKKEFVNGNLELRRIGKNIFEIDNNWYLIEDYKVNNAVSSINVNLSEWYKATVPGTVLTSLVNNGIHPDPYYGINNVFIPDTLCRMDWWYRTEFVIPKDIEHKNLILTFYGINYKAEIWLNENYLGNISGAFKKGTFDITGFVKRKGKNVLAVKIIPPHNPGIPHEQSLRAVKGPNGGSLCLDGPTFICSEGWDWMPGIKDRNIGIWQDVTISSYGNVTAEDIHITTDLNLPDTINADIQIEMDLVNRGAIDEEGVISVHIDTNSIDIPYSISGNSRKTIKLNKDGYNQLSIKNPRLWWPNGYGEQNLYDAEIIVTDRTGNSDYKNVRFGIRELEYEFAVEMGENNVRTIRLNPIEAYKNGNEIIDRINRLRIDNELEIPRLMCTLPYDGIEISKSENPYLTIIVNGKKIFCRGGNWGMDDAMKRYDKKDLEPYFLLHKKQNFNIIRNWTGESTQQSFYELCDEYGMLVFNDFWMSTENYNLEPLDFELFCSNVLSTVKRFRNHPSIAIWCPRNEGYAPEYLEKEISRIITKYDGTRYNVGNSRYLNTINSGPWDFNMETDYFNMAKGFASEIGTFSVPTYRSLNKMMDKEDQWPIGDVWCYHDWHYDEWPNLIKYNDYMDSVYVKFNDAEMFCEISQIQGFDSYRSIFEAWNSKLWKNTTGVLLWMSHPAWPSTIWQTYTWDYETTGAYYGSKKACEPIHIQFNPIDKTIECINLSSTKLKDVHLEYHFYTMNGDNVMTGFKTTDLYSNSCSKEFNIENIMLDKSLKLLRLYMKNNGGEIISVNDYLINNFTDYNRKDIFKLNKVDIKVDEIKKHKNYTEICLINSSSKIALGVKLSLKDEKGKYILPSIFSDGYFNLLPNEKRIICIDKTIDENIEVEIDCINNLIERVKGVKLIKGL